MDETRLVMRGEGQVPTAIRQVESLKKHRLLVPLNEYRRGHSGGILCVVSRKVMKILHLPIERFVPLALFHDYFQQ